MKSFFFIVALVFFSGLHIIQIIFGQLFLFGSLELLVSIVLCILIPFFSIKNFSFDTHSLLFKNIILIFLMSFFRFLCDLLIVTPTIEKGPVFPAFLLMCTYFVYFNADFYCKQLGIKKIIDLIIYTSFAICIVYILYLIASETGLIKNAQIEAAAAVTDAENTTALFRVVNDLYTFSELAVVLIFYKLSYSKSTGSVLVLVAGMVLNLFIILIAGFRAPMYSLVLVLGAYLFIFLKGTSIKKKIIFSIGALSLFAVIGSIAYLRTNTNVEVEDHSDFSLLYRNIESLQAIAKYYTASFWVYLFGVGYADGFVNLLMEYYSPDKSGETYFLHNGYISILYNYGIFGVVVFSVFLWNIISYIMKRLTAEKNNRLFVLMSLFIVGQLLVNYSSGVFNRNQFPLFVFLVTVVLLERSVTQPTVK